VPKTRATPTTGTASAAQNNSSNFTDVT